MNRTPLNFAVITIALLATSLVSAQTTQPGDAINSDLIFFDTFGTGSIDHWAGISGS